LIANFLDGKDHEAQNQNHLPGKNLEEAIMKPSLTGNSSW